MARHTHTAKSQSAEAYKASCTAYVLHKITEDNYALNIHKMT